MKVEELMVGDIVRVAKDVCLKEGTIVIISGIDANNELHRKKLQGSVTCFELGDELRITCGVWAEYLEPIPLTPEILEKNGFVKFIAGQYILPREDNEWLVNIAPDISGLPNSNGTMLVAIKNVYTDAKIAISYVHQLQHALRLCDIDQKITL